MKLQSADPNTVDTEGVVEVPGFRIPFSSLASAAARADLILSIKNPQPGPVNGDLVGWRRHLDATCYVPQKDTLLSRYPVRVEEFSIAGVPLARVSPYGSVAERNIDRVLVELHAGGFVCGGLANGISEAIPIAHAGSVAVIVVDYRMAPEHKFPAASEDVAKVYAGLLERYPARNIGIFGSSAGGLLSAQAVAWFDHVGLPQPGAVGVLSCGACSWADGDSGFWAFPLNGATGPSVGELSSHYMVHETPYLSEVDLKDPLVGPAWSLPLLGKFPPTLLIAGTRSMELSAVAFTHSRLIAAGVKASLHLWEGVGHAFYCGNYETPEAREANDVIVKFFDHHLGVGNGASPQPST
jgi:epsilon-lactone hydrolase